ncbi:MAG: methyltransferase domain-containing protein [Cytophagales bacterium]|nr:MAG: methyltransferase domain-containing protein [Cytophagales bacterium]
MASLAKDYDNQKLLGQVYTPRFVVEKILSDIGFDTSTILGKTVLDPSCGDGRFLVVVAEKIIEFSPEENLRENLEKIYGWDIDNQAIAYCIENLNELIKPLDIKVNWNISATNSLEKIQDNTQTFDFIVGNPPYIRIQHLAEIERKFIQMAYKFCKSGSTDTYIAFYELCNFLLAQNGICALITPNTFFYSETAKVMRAYFAHQQTIIKITNYGDIQLFDNATTYSAITIFGKEVKNELIFEQANTNITFEQRMIDFSEIKNQRIWQLSLENTINRTGTKLKDICNIHVGITTLCDKGYIFKVKEIEDEPDFVWAETKLKGLLKLEKSILKPIIKASKIKNSTDKVIEYILFPYQKEKGKHKIIKEGKLENDFPLAYNYLLSIKDELDKRDNGKRNTLAWYAFGRSQGLDTSFGKKILFSPMNNKPNFVLFENEECTFYSGYCIKYKGNFDFLLSALNSEKMADYMQVSSRDFRGGWKAYNKKALEEFTILEEEKQNNANHFIDKITSKKEQISLF